MKENKKVQIKFRLTESLNAQIKKYCAAHEINVSELMRLAVSEFLNKTG